MSRRATDVMWAIGLTLVLAIAVSADQAADRPLTPVAYLWAAGLGALMLIRRSHPLLVLALTTLGFFSYYAAGFPAIGVSLPIAAALFSAAEMGYTRAAALTGTGVLAVATVFRLAVGQDPAFVVAYELPGHAALIAGSVALGHSRRVTARLRQRTAQVARLLELQTETDAKIRAREERLQLARELHDALGHSLSIASLYTGIARDTTPESPGHHEALEHVRDAVSEALKELRATVSLLRARSGTPEVQAPRLEELRSLVATPVAAGYQVVLDIEDVRATDDVEVAAYRVVQEAITNTLRHSTGNRIVISVAEESPGLMSVSVADDGQGAKQREIRDGHGLAGMRERVIDLGGTLEVKADTAGWRVEATIPTGANP